MSKRTCSSPSSYVGLSVLFVPGSSAAAVPAVQSAQANPGLHPVPAERHAEGYSGRRGSGFERAARSACTNRLGISVIAGKHDGLVSWIVARCILDTVYGAA